jgi:hypothetical protein
MPIPPAYRRLHQGGPGLAAAGTATRTATPRSAFGNNLDHSTTVALPRHALPAVLAGMPRRRALVTRAAMSAAPPPDHDETLAQALSNKGLSIPAGHAGLDLQTTLEVRAALATMFENTYRRQPGEVIRSACAEGLEPRFNALLCLIRAGVLDPNCPWPRSLNRYTLLHAIAIHGCDGSDYAPGYVRLSQRVKALVELGTDINARDRVSNMTACDYAMMRNEERLLAALVRHGGVTSR